MYLLKQRHGKHHNTEHNHREYRDGNNKNQCRLHVDGKRHNHRAKHNERRAHKQAQYHIYPGLHLVDIARHASYHRGSPKVINLRVGQTLDMRKQRVPELCRASDRRLRRKKLRRQGADKTDYTKRHHQQAHAHNIRSVTIRNTHINNFFHYKRNEEFKEGF